MKRTIKVKGNEVNVFAMNYSSMRDYANDVVLFTSVIDEKRSVRLDNPDRDAIMMYLYMQSFSDMDMSVYKKDTFEDELAAFMNDMMAEGYCDMWRLIGEEDEDWLVALRQISTVEKNIDRMLKADTDVCSMLGRFLKPILEENDIAHLLADSGDLGEKLMTLMQKATAYDDAAKENAGKFGQAALLKFAKKETSKK